MKPINVSIVVVTYNPYQSGFFPRCLEHLMQVQTMGMGYQLHVNTIIVDSASSDNSPQLIRSNFPEVEVIASDQNLGYAGGNNLGFKEAMKSQPDYIAVVTQDVYVKPDWLLQAVKTAESDTQIGAVQPLLLLWPDREKINSTGNAIHFLGYGYAGHYQLPLRNYDEKEVQEIPYCSGAVLLLRTKALQEVGDFDDEMWMYNEDQDLGWRMWLKGYRQVMAPFSRVYHQYEFSRSIQKMYYMDRNRLLVVLQNYHWATLLLVLPFLLVNELAGFILAWRGGWLKEKISVWKYFLRPKHWKLLFQKRRQRQQGRASSEKDIIKRFTGGIYFQDISQPVIKYIANPILSAIWFVLQRLIIW